jgi:hypothetical protein
MDSNGISMGLKLDFYRFTNRNGYIMGYNCVYMYKQLNYGGLRSAKIPWSSSELVPHPQLINRVNECAILDEI